MKNTLATPADVTPEDAAPEGQVSDNSLSKERKLEISDAKKGPKLNQKIVEDLFEKRGSTDEFRHHLSLVTKTGNTEDVIKVIRTRLSIVDSDTI